MKKHVKLLSVILLVAMTITIVVSCGVDLDKADISDDISFDPDNADLSNLLELMRPPEAGVTTPDDFTLPEDLLTSDDLTLPPITSLDTSDFGTLPATTTEDPHYHPPFNDYYPKNGIITNANELHSVLNDGDPTKDYFVAAKEIDMTDRRWSGLKDFSGTFDFGNCRLKGVEYPMFISVKGGTVKNLVVADSAQRYSYGDSIADASLVVPNDDGGVIRYLDNGTVSNVTVESDVDIDVSIWENMNSGNVKGRGGFGGIVGYATGKNTLLERCVFKGTVSTDSLMVNIGGVCGKVECNASFDPLSFTTEAVPMAIGCSNYGTVNNFATGNDSKTGGVFGAFGSGIMYKCANYGTVASNDGGQTAGVCAMTLQNIYVYGCLNAGEVSGAIYAGGVIGYSNGAARVYVACINTGLVSSEGKYSGGIVGFARSSETFIDCYNLRSVNNRFGCTKNTEIDPTNSLTHFTENGKLIMMNCGNLSTVEEIMASVGLAHRGVFVKVGNTIVVS